ncbi:MAG: Rossmann-fold NAD(P)-binding domain-containing protein [Candidatus Doudnabacteria bacterium]
MPQKKFLVLGATGTLGSVVATELEAQGAKVFRVGHRSPEIGGMQCNVADHRSVYNIAQKVREAIGSEGKIDGVFYGVSRHAYAECQHARYEDVDAYQQAPALAEMLNAEVIGLQIVLEQFAPMIRDGGKFAVASPVFAHQGHGDPSFWGPVEAAGINLWPYVAVKRMQSDWVYAWTRSPSCRFTVIEVPARLIVEGPITGILEGLPEHFFQRAYMFAQATCRLLLED